MMFLDFEFLTLFIPAVILALLVVFVMRIFTSKKPEKLQEGNQEKFPFWIAIILGILAIFGHGVIGWLFPSFLGGYVFLYLLFFTPYFAINFLGFGFTKKKTALLVLGISTAILIIGASIFFTR
ncbi:MAG: hypothetical protein ACI8V7_000707 [Candidatus Paceibacteria bacterium]|jgi:hypothetical protein